MHRTFERAGRQFGFDWEKHPTMPQLEDATRQLQADWAFVMGVYDQFITERRKAKAAGRRPLSKVEEVRLYNVRRQFLMRPGA